MNNSDSERPRVSVGIPVYNGEPFLADALACLSRQDFADAEFIICDNSSTDRTAEIAADFASSDHRFRVIRQAETKPADENFSAVLAAARGEFFCWRAADDLSSDNFLSELTFTLAANPGCMLATCQINNIRGANPAIIRTRPAPAMSAKPDSLWFRLKLLHMTRAASFYGLWRREDIVRIFAQARATFPYLVAQDVLVLLSPIMQGRVATTNGTIFVQRLKDKSGAEPVIPFYAIREPAQQAKVRSAFRELALEQLRALDMPLFHKLALRFATAFYVDRRVYRLWRIWLGQINARKS